MAVVGAVIGVGILGAILHDDHSDYSDYSNYSNYSDAAERRRRRQEAKEREISEQKEEINTYKTDNVNDYLQSVSLKQENGVSVNVEEVKKDGDYKIDNDVKRNVDRESANLNADIEQINQVLKNIDKILRED